jgi:hypothetical protein
MPSPTSSEPNTVADFPEPDIDYGIITDGLCDTPEHQDEFDAQQKGKPPAHD